ncbi:SurA N-terminal domain-containing protein [Microbaculum marinum]|uniref:SurA N-terminal domain-containing protein n=1 Tax=Microbaculum marinum TaxID=1764581 RepID=A0AAW9RT22_9HYPH
MTKSTGPFTNSRLANAFAGAAIAVLAACATIASGGVALASSIEILVNDDPITEYDISQRSKLITATSGGAAGGNVRQRAIDELIDEKLKLQEANRMGVTVTAAQVDDAFGVIATRVKLPPAQFSQALQQIGVNPATLKKRLEADLSWRDVVRARFNSSVNIRDRDIETALARKGEEMPTTTEELAIQQIIFIIPQNSSADYIRQRKADASAYRNQYSGCDTALQLAKNYRDVVVKDIVRRNLSDLGPLVSESLADVQVNGISAPNETPSAIEMLGVCDRVEIKDDSAARKQVQAELMNEQGERLSRRLLIDLKQSAVVEYR